MTAQSSLKQDVLIRGALSADEAAIYNFITELEEASLDRAVFRLIYEQNLANPAVYYLVAENDRKEIVGFVSCHVQLLLHHCGKVGEIQELFVHSTMRNQGIGQCLVDKLKAIAIQEELTNLEVTTNQKRIDTIRFYEREQFNRTHVKLVYTIPSFN